MRTLTALLAALILAGSLLGTPAETPAPPLELASDGATDAPQYAEQWTNLAGWTAQGLTTSGGRLYAGPTSPRGAGRALNTDGDTRLRASIVLKTGGVAGSGLTLAGVAVGTPGAAVAGGNLIALGFDPAGRVVLYQGTAVGGAGLEVLYATPQRPGWYWVTVTTDATGLMLTLGTSDGAKEWRTAIRRSDIGAPMTQAAVWNSDPRGLAGSSIGALGYRESARPVTVGTGIEDRAPSSSWGWGPNGTALRVALPAGYDGAAPLPLVIYAHGSSGSELSILDIDMHPITRTLLAAGYAVASSSQHGNNWGNDASVGDLISLYGYVNARYPVGEVFLLGHSMGGLSSLQAAVDGGLPVQAWAGIYPVTNLRAMWDAGRYRDAINAAHGVTSYTAALDAHNPTTFDPALFDGLPMRYYASPDDTIVEQDSNALTLAQRLAGHAVEGVVVPHVGEHGDPTAFDPYDLLSFFDRHRAGGAA